MQWYKIKHSGTVLAAMYDKLTTSVGEITAFASTGQPDVAECLVCKKTDCKYCINLYTAVYNANKEALESGDKFRVGRDKNMHYFVF